MFKNFKIFIFTLIPIIAGMLLIYLISENFVYQKIDNNIINLNQEISANTLNTEEEKPKYFYFDKNTNAELKVSSEVYIVGDLNTGEIILSKNPENKLPIASIGKY